VTEGQSARIVAFVEARLADEVQVANAAGDAFLHGDRIGIDPYKMHPSVRMHVYSWTPARVLRDVETKRAMLAAVRKILDRSPQADHGGLLAMLQLMALVWDGHPDYDETWRP
jgi:hypothetical protein